MGRGGAGDTAIGSEYGTVSGFIFIFNLIVGTGALALPKAMNDAGWVLSVPPDKHLTLASRWQNR